MGGPLVTRYITAYVTTVAGTAQASPKTTTVNLGDLILISVHLQIPSGHCGLTGWRIDYSGVTIVPFNNPPTFIVGDDDHLDFDTDYEVGNALKIITYNTDIYDHTHYATLKVTDLNTPRPAPFIPLVITSQGV